MTNEQKTLFSAVIALKFSRIVFQFDCLSRTHTTPNWANFVPPEKKDGKESFTFINYCSFPFNSTESERINTSIVVHLGFPISVHKFTQICRTFFSACVIVFLSTSALEEEKDLIVWVCVCVLVRARREQWRRFWQFRHSCSLLERVSALLAFQLSLSRWERVVV